MFYAFFSTQNFHSSLSHVVFASFRHAKRDCRQTKKNLPRTGRASLECRRVKKHETSGERIFIGIFFINCTRRESKARRVEETRADWGWKPAKLGQPQQSRARAGECVAAVALLHCKKRESEKRSIFLFIFFHMIKSIKIPLFLQIFTINFYMIFPSHYSACHFDAMPSITSSSERTSGICFVFLLHTTSRSHPNQQPYPPRVWYECAMKHSKF